MNFNRTVIALLISSALFVNSQAVMSNDGKKKLRDLLNQQKRSSSQTSQLLTKGHFDAQLQLKSFNCNFGQIKNIPLDKNLASKTQHASAINQYFKQIASEHYLNS